MALESFGSEIAKQVNHAVILCHDLLLESEPDVVNENFKAGDRGIWKVYAGYSSESTRRKVVKIELGVG